MTFRPLVGWRAVAGIAVAAALAGGYVFFAGFPPPDVRPPAAERPVRAAIDRPSGRISAGHYQVTARPILSQPDYFELHEWVISVGNGAGAPLAGCQVSFDGSMPEHGHGLPTAPRVTRESRPGEYVVEGVRFSMPGHWMLLVRVAGCGPPEEAAFAFNI